jgi:hypothetical protein
VRTAIRRSVTSGLTASGGVLALLVGLALIDERVRERLTRLYSSGAGRGEIATAGAQLRDMAEVLAVAVRDQSVDQAPLVIFGLAAIVLLLFMLRT